MREIICQATGANRRENIFEKNIDKVVCNRDSCCACRIVKLRVSTRSRAGMAQTRLGKVGGVFKCGLHFS